MDEQRTTAERRRALLEKVTAVIAAMDRILCDLHRDEVLAWALRLVTEALPTLRSIREHAEGALAGDLEDDAAWAELLTMMLQEVADGCDECAH